MENGLVFKWSATPPQGGGVPLLPILGVPFYLCTHPLTQNYQISHDDTYGDEACFFVVTHTPLQEDGVPAFPNFWSSLIFMRTVHPLPQNYQISRDNTYGEGLVFRG